ncbi:MAG: tRNA-binding protein [bacterium]|nr:tRNA-binding protein [bacterium]
MEDFPQARKPAFKLTIDFGKEIGIKRSSARIVDLYKHHAHASFGDIITRVRRSLPFASAKRKKEDLEGTLVLGVVNFPPKQIGPFISECLALGVPDEQGRVVLVRPDKDAPVGSKLF